jgi:hypothetical protein
MNLPDAHPGDVWTSGTNFSSCCHKPLDLLSVAYWEFRMPVAKAQQSDFMMRETYASALSVKLKAPVDRIHPARRFVH